MSQVANHVGFKVLKLVSWLVQAPLSRDEILERFSALDGKTLSPDTIELYMATLRQAGCIIKRPSSKSGGRYRLQAHTFGAPCDAQTWEALSKIWDIAEEALSPQEMLVFYRWLLRYFNALGNGDTVRAQKAHFIASKRLTTLLTLEDLLLSLCQYCESHHPLDLLYHSAGKGPRNIEIVPESVVFKGGQLYLLGETSLSPEQVMLRLDRILRVAPLALSSTPSLFPRAIPSVVVRFLWCRPEALPQLTGLLTLESPPESPNQTIASFAGDNPFLLTQELLESGLMFEIISPSTFQTQISDQLNAMEALYDDVG